MLASVCPRRSCSPPETEIKGKTWPGRAKSDGCELISASALKVFARSSAGIPVERPAIASTVTVNAVL